MNHARAIAGLNWETGMIRLIDFKEGDEGLLVGMIVQNDGDYQIKVTINPFYSTGELLKKVEEVITHLEKYVGGDRELPPLIELLAHNEANEEKEMVSTLGF